MCPDLFRPDPRVGARQKTCGKPACQKARHAKQQGLWRQANPDYFTNRRLQQRQRQAELAKAESAQWSAEEPASVRAPSAPKLPHLWRRIPWDLVQAELGVLTADVLALVIRLLLEHYLSAGCGGDGSDSS